MVTPESVAKTPVGWSTPAWRARLSYMANTCRFLRPDLARLYEKAASLIEVIDEIESNWTDEQVAPVLRDRKCRPKN